MKLNMNSLTIIFALCVSQMLSAFTIINQTEKDKVVIVQEAYRPKSDKPGNVEYPIPLSKKETRIKIPRKSVYTSIKIKPCTVLLLSIVTPKGKNHSLITTRCFEPYSYFATENVTEITDLWGIVIHKFIPPHYIGFGGFDFGIERDRKLGYGIKLLHPQYLAQIDSLDSLPQELLLQ